MGHIGIIACLYCFVIHRWLIWCRKTSDIVSKCVHICCKFRCSVNTLRPRQNGRHFADDTFKCIFLKENVRISIKISLKFVLRVQLIMFQHCFRLWLGADQATSHYLNQWWLLYGRIHASFGVKISAHYKNTGTVINSLSTVTNSLSLSLSLSVYIYILYGRSQVSVCDMHMKEQGNSGDWCSNIWC